MLLKTCPHSYTIHHMNTVLGTNNKYLTNFFTTSEVEDLKKGRKRKVIVNLTFYPLSFQTHILRLHSNYLTLILQTYIKIGLSASEEENRGFRGNGSC